MCTVKTSLIYCVFAMAYHILSTIHTTYYTYSNSRQCSQICQYLIQPDYRNLVEMLIHRYKLCIDTMTHFMIAKSNTENTTAIVTAVILTVEFITVLVSRKCNKQHYQSDKLHLLIYTLCTSQTLSPSIQLFFISLFIQPIFNCVISFVK